MEVQIVRTDGREETHEIPGSTGTQIFAAIRRLIDATSLDTVNLRDGRVMLVDDHGYDVEVVEHGAGPGPFGPAAFRTELRPIRALKPVNPHATALYHGVCHPGTTHQIVGDVAIVHEKDFR